MELARCLRQSTLRPLLGWYGGVPAGCQRYVLLHAQQVRFELCTSIPVNWSRCHWWERGWLEQLQAASRPMGRTLARSAGSRLQAHAAPATPHLELCLPPTLASARVRALPPRALIKSSSLGLTVNTAKTKVMLLSGARTVPASRQLAEAAGLLFAGQPVPTVTEFKFLGITFHSTTNMAGAACPARTQLARLALSNTRARWAELGWRRPPSTYGCSA